VACPGRDGGRGCPAPRLRQSPSRRARLPPEPASTARSVPDPLSNYGIKLTRLGRRFS